MKKRIPFAPTGSKILVRLDPPAEEKVGSLYAVGDPPRDRGTVAAMGVGILLPDGRRLPFEVSIGERVLFNAEASREIEVAGEKFTIVDHDDIAAVIA